MSNEIGWDKKCNIATGIFGLLGVVIGGSIQVLAQMYFDSKKEKSEAIKAIVKEGPQLIREVQLCQSRISLFPDMIVREKAIKNSTNESYAVLMQGVTECIASVHSLQLFNIAYDINKGDILEIEEVVTNYKDKIYKEFLEENGSADITKIVKANMEFKHYWNIEFQKIYSIFKNKLKQMQ